MADRADLPDDVEFAALVRRMTDEQLSRAENGWWQSELAHSAPGDPFGPIARAHVLTCKSERTRRIAERVAA